MVKGPHDPQFQRVGGQSLLLFRGPLPIAKNFLGTSILCANDTLCQKKTVRPFHFLCIQDEHLFINGNFIC